MDTLRQFMDVGQSAAKLMYTVDPGYLRATMPALQDAAFVASLAWILYRIWQIYQKPVDELVNLLGLDIPPVPEVSLAGITTEGVLLYWKPPESQHASLTHGIHVNGIKVGEFGRGDTSIQVTGLKPGHFYSIRVIASNAANFSTLGPLIHLRTLPLPAKANGVATTNHDKAGSDAEHNEAAAIRVSPAHPDLTTSQPMAREHGSGQGQPRQAGCGRRNSPASPNAENMLDPSVATDQVETTPEDDSIERLTARLDTLRREQSELDKQVLEEEVDFKHSIANLTIERDQLKQTSKEREEASIELKKQANLTHKRQKSALSKKAQKERLLNEKKAEKQKTKEEILRWKQEIVEMRQDVEDMSREQADVLSSKDQVIADVRTAMAEDQAVIRSLEEEIRATGSKIKAMQEHREKISDSLEEDLVLAAQERQGDREWEAHVQSLDVYIRSLITTLRQGEADNARARTELARWTSSHARDPTQFAAISAIDSTPSMRSNHSRRSRQGNSRTNTLSSPPGSYAVGPGFFNHTSTMSPSFSSVSPFFNMGNGMAVPPPIDQAGVFQAETEALTAGVPMSPTADGLLPSNLFREDDTMIRRITAATAQESVGGVVSDAFVKLGDPPSQAPHTPVSAGSHSGSRFSSPHDSLRNVLGYSVNGDLSQEPDRRSVHSTSASFHSPMTADANPLATNRLTGFFTFNRQRGKAGNNEPPQLGTLKQGQSQSFPRDFGDEELDVNGARRRRGSYGHWANPMGLLNRNGPEDGSLIRARTGSGRRSRFFGNNSNPLQPSALTDHPSSARPSSINSFDQILGRPSSESQRNPWTIPETNQNRSSPLGTSWATNGPWSRGPSRRPSVQHGSTSNLSIGSTPLEPDYQSGLSKQVSEQLPIGTRPRGGSGQSSQRPVTPKLNPTAPSFKTLFGRGEAKKTAKADKAAEKAKEKASDAEEDSLHEEPSPQNPRTSRDAQSIVTSASISESHESLDRSTSGTPSEVVTPSGHKESFMQRISRKGSSSKFNVSWVKDRGGLFSRKGGDTTPSGTPSGELDEDADSEKLEEHAIPPAQPTEKSSRSSLSWPNIRRKTKKNGIQSGEMDRNHEGEEDEER